jgi:hypothetical protein
MSLYSGAFLDDFMDVVQYWYQRGIRMFKLDFADFTVAVKGDENRLRPQEIRLRNGRALHAALRTFRRNHPDVVLVGFNGFVGNVDRAPQIHLRQIGWPWIACVQRIEHVEPLQVERVEGGCGRVVRFLSLGV